MDQCSRVTTDLWTLSYEFQSRLEHVQRSSPVQLVEDRCTRVHRREEFLWNCRRMFPVSGRDRNHRSVRMEQGILPDEILTNADDDIGMFHSDQVLVADDRPHCLDCPQTRPNAAKTRMCSLKRVGRDLPRKCIWTCPKRSCVYPRIHPVWQCTHVQFYREIVPKSKADVALLRLSFVEENELEELWKSVYSSPTFAVAYRQWN